MLTDDHTLSVGRRGGEGENWPPASLGEDEVQEQEEEQEEQEKEQESINQLINQSINQPINRFLLPAKSDHDCNRNSVTINSLVQKRTQKGTMFPLARKTKIINTCDKKTTYLWLYKP